ncbi:3-oxoacyl-[acyl-carrier protein] reductase [Sediminihabitans luteus]|uniref:3-oxoacyl-[acyl-carrier protein] reductase n=1 Tax=Sediminihabitans luteus TaxID=1138585 RepID=A0A2M9D0A9_9CELL|nr:3-oxoacyl-ACP reductase [Sediminihabitans luteus]PJJ77624.1 3-oxoacyl-[acyl-carrier protein] reductase [Sediminihabitans luteus]GII98524.1 3-oxoacyl-ACP reductase [Sediminihabitans luteus]
MTDSYLNAVNAGFTKTLAKKLGLPQPAVLRRYEPGAPLVPGPVLVVGGTPGVHDDADDVAAALLRWDLDVRQAPADASERWGAVVVVLTGAERPGDVSQAVLAVAGHLRSLARGGRVVVLSRAPGDDDAPAIAATRQGVDGFVRSLAKELRGGATGNGVQLTAGAQVGDPAVLAALHFFLSAKSAFVDGQLLRVGDGPAWDASGFDWSQPLAGRVAVVTGAARGIGAEVARTLARDGAKVVVVDVPAAGEALTAVANEIKGTALQLDVTADDAGARILEHARARHGGLHVLVHNAGILRDKLLANMTPEKWDAVIAVNLESQLRITEHLLEVGGFSETPHVVSLASTSGIAGNRGQTNYGFSKAGVIGHTRAHARLLAPLGGTANAVAPGFIETDMTASIPLVPRQVARRASSLQQGGQPIDVAEAIAFLASPGTTGISGQVLRVCGQNLVGA